MIKDIYTIEETGRASIIDIVAFPALQKLAFYDFYKSQYAGKDYQGKLWDSPGEANAVEIMQYLHEQRKDMMNLVANDSVLAVNKSKSKNKAPEFHRPLDNLMKEAKPIFDFIEQLAKDLEKGNFFKGE